MILSGLCNAVKKILDKILCHGHFSLSVILNPNKKGGFSLNSSVIHAPLHDYVQLSLKYFYVATYDHVAQHYVIWQFLLLTSCMAWNRRQLNL